MEVAILRTDGTPVRLGSYIQAPKFDTNGFLVGFTDKIEYKYYQNVDFKKQHREKRNLEGYYAEKAYLSYIQDKKEAPSIDDLLKRYMYDFDNYIAKAGESVSISKIDFGAPYNYLYKKINYTFTVQNDITGTGIKNYKQGTYESLKLVDYEISVPSDAIKSTVEIDLSKDPLGYFYEKNLGAFVNDWDITDDEKSRFKKRTTLIIFRISEIVREVLDKILDVESLHLINQTALQTTEDLTALSSLERAVFELKKGWGYFYVPSSDPKYVHRHNFDPVFSKSPDYGQYSSYYNSLLNLYKRTYQIRDKLLDYPEDTRLQHLLEVLPVKALKQLPLSIIKYALLDFIKREKIDEKEEQFIVRLVLAVKSEYADGFLDFLLERNNGKTTNFESLYNLLDDARIERISYVNVFFNEETNRRYYAFAIYELWTVSKYNIGFFPSGTTPNAEKINPDAYFIKNDKEFRKDNVVSFEDGFKLEPTSQSQYETFASKTFGVICSIKNRKVSIAAATGSIATDKRTHMVRYAGDQTIDYGEFHLYHPLSLVNYTANLDLKIPRTTVIPAFLFYFAEEYDRLAEFDANISLIIDVTVEALFFYFSGGVSQLADLQYLRSFTDVGKALRGVLPQTRLIEVWRGVEGASNVVNLVASQLLSINEYLTKRETDTEKVKYQKKVHTFFLTVLMSSSVFNVFASQKCSAMASKLLDDIENVEEVIHGISDEVVQLLKRIKGGVASSVGRFETKMTTVFDSNVENFVKKSYDEFSEAKKLVFKNQFENASFEIWEQLNNYGQSNRVMKNWSDLIDLNIYEAKDIGLLLKQQRVNGYLRFYKEDELRIILQRYTSEQRAAFFDSCGSVRQVDDEAFGLLLVNPKMRIDFLYNSRYIEATAKDRLVVNEVVAILKSTLHEDHIGVLSYKSYLSWAETILNYRKKIKNIDIGLEDLINLNNRLTDFFSSQRKLRLFMEKNRLFTETEIYKKGVFVRKEKEFFLSGNKEAVEEVFRRSGGEMVYPENLVEPNYEDFINFNLKAIDSEGVSRGFDTELKYIFNFVKKHLQDGDHFKIKMESTLYTCTSCQKYLQALQLYVNSQNKTLEIVYLSNKEYKTMSKIKLLLKKNK